MATADVGRLLAAIKSIESGNYNAPPNGGGASGAYQIIDSTWAGNGGTVFARSAYLATPAQQDTVATRMVTNYQRPYLSAPESEQVANVAMQWFVGHVVTTKAEMNAVPHPEAGNNISPKTYVQRMFAAYGDPGNKLWDDWQTRHLNILASGVGASDLPGLAGALATHPGDALKAFGDPLSGIEAVGHFFSLLSEWDTWRRILLIVGGVALLGAAFAIFTADDAPPIVKTAALAAGV